MSKENPNYSVLELTRIVTVYLDEVPIKVRLNILHESIAKIDF